MDIPVTMTSRCAKLTQPRHDAIASLNFRMAKKKTMRPTNITTVTITLLGCAQWRSSLRHCATSQKDAGSIRDGMIGVFR